MKRILLKDPLLHGVARGEKRYFDLFYEKYYLTIFRSSFFILKNVEETEEVVIDVFLKIWEHRKKLLSIKDIDSYLFVLAKNEALKRHKQQLKYRTVSLESIQSDYAITDSPTPDQILITSETLSKIRGELKLLPPRCREIFLLSREYGFSVRKIADLLELHENTVRTHLNTALKKIRKSVFSFF